MYRIAVVGDYDSIYGFATLGLEIHVVTDQSMVASTVKHLAEENCAVIYITEAAAAQIPELVDYYRTRLTPAIIQIPGISNNTGAGILGVKDSVKQAVGSDILFGDE